MAKTAMNRAGRKYIVGEVGRLVVANFLPAPGALVDTYAEKPAGKR